MNEIESINFLRESLEQAILLLHECKVYISFTNPVGSGISLIIEIESFDKMLSKTIGGEHAGKLKGP